MELGICMVRMLSIENVIRPFPQSCKPGYPFNGNYALPFHDISFYLSDSLIKKIKVRHCIWGYTIFYSKYIPLSLRKKIFLGIHNPGLQNLRKKKSSFIKVLSYCFHGIAKVLSMNLPDHPIVTSDGHYSFADDSMIWVDWLDGWMDGKPLNLPLL